MKKLHIYIIQSFIGPFILTFAIVVFVLLMQFLWKYIDELAGKGLDATLVVEFLAYSAASLVPMAVPLAVLLASIMTLGSLGENYELLAIKSAGVSLQRILYPVMVLCTAITIGSFAFSNYVLPFTALKMQSLLWDIRNKKPQLQLTEGVFTTIDNYNIYIGKKDYTTNTLFDLIMYETSGPRRENLKMTIADSGFMLTTPDERFLVVDLYNGYNYEEVQQERSRARARTYPFRRNHFAQQTFRIDLSEFDLNRTDESLFKKGYQMMDIGQLSTYSDSLSTVIDSISLNLEGLVKARLMPLKIFPRLYAEPQPGQLELPDDFANHFATVSPTEQLESIRAALKNTGDMQYETQMTHGGSINELSTQQRRYRSEWQRKFSLSFACLMLFFVGAPLGAIIRKGGLGTPMVISVLIFVFYYVISITGEKFARDGSLTPFLGMWVSTFIVLPIGIFLTWQATHESALMNMDTYVNLIRRFREWIGTLTRK